MAGSGVKGLTNNKSRRECLNHNLSKFAFDSQQKMKETSVPGFCIPNMTTVYKRASLSCSSLLCTILVLPGYSSKQWQNNKLMRQTRILVYAYTRILILYVNMCMVVRTYTRFVRVFRLIYF